MYGLRLTHGRCWGGFFFFFLFLALLQEGEDGGEEEEERGCGDCRDWRNWRDGMRYIDWVGLGSCGMLNLHGVLSKEYVLHPAHYTLPYIPCILYTKLHALTLTQYLSSLLLSSPLSSSSLLSSPLPSSPKHRLLTC